MIKTLEELQVEQELKRLQKEINYWKFGVLACIAVLSLAYLWWFHVHHTFSLSSDPASWGQMGDFFGGLLNPLVAFSAFYWLTRSVALQKQELADTRAELEKTATAQSKQVEKSQISVQIAAISSLNDMFVSEIKRAEANLAKLSIESASNDSLKRRYFEERLWEHQRLQNKIAQILVIGVNGGWPKEMPFLEMPADSWYLKINIEIRDAAYFATVSLFYGCKMLEKMDNQRRIFPFIVYCLRHGPADMFAWNVQVDDLEVGYCIFERGNTGPVLADIQNYVTAKHHDVDRQMFQ